ncbi:NADH-quinone oxidoreductase subunit L [Marinobacteraceae bacterium S3BR75-40.1]
MADGAVLTLLWWIPLLPLAGFAVLALFGGYLSRAGVAWVGVGSVALAALAAAVLAVEFYSLAPAARSLTQTLGSWLAVSALSVDFTLRLDELSMVMLLVVTGVGFLIHLYSAEFMAAERDYRRYFAYLNLFVAAMLVLVLADNLVLLFMGWEGVGLCSYLLIGYWYQDPANGAAARKAFVVTRVGDVALLLGLFLLFDQFSSLQIPELLAGIGAEWANGSELAVLAGFLVLGGAVGKSAQLPLQVWLPDAMAGPSPVSALIHAATMVTAGVYLIARLHPLFEVAPAAQLAVAVVGALTLLLSGFAALSQRDIKRILAYSTISQIGYMFLALGVGAWSAAIFHLVTHAFFKALLFLSAGVIIHHLHDEHDVFRMGGLRKTMPLTFAAFLAGASSLAALPWVTAGFYSKDPILMAAWHAPQAGGWLLAAALLGALLTAVYSFRAVFLVFGGEPATQERERLGWRIAAPFGVLLVLSLVGGVIALPLSGVFPESEEAHAGWIKALAVAVAVGGVALAGWLYGRSQSPWRQGRPHGVVDRLWAQGWGFDALYHGLLVWPLTTLARLNRRDGVDRLVDAVVWCNGALHAGLSQLQTGLLRHYALGILVGALLMVGMGVWL